MLNINFVLLLLGVSNAFGLYTSDDDVVELTAKNFREEVMESDELWLVEFYAPWCGHCQRLAPEWKKAATNLRGLANIGAVDMDQHQSVGAPYGIKGFPTIKVFGANKNSPKDYNGARDSGAIVSEAMKYIQEMVAERQSGGSSGGSGKKSSGGGRKSGGGGSGTTDVVTLTDSNFKDLVMDGDETWLVEFYAPWCGHCKNLEPEWRSAASTVKDKSGGTIKLGALDATVNTATASKYGIRGYPTIKIFRAGFKNDPMNYEGARDASGIVNAAMEYFSIDPPSIDELVSQEVFDEKCKEHICILAFLPDLYDTGKDGRNHYIETLKRMGEKYKNQGWGWMWIPGRANDDLESNLRVGGSGYPTVVAIRIRKNVFASYTGEFSEDKLNSFFSVLTYGRGKNTFELPALPELPTRDAWDGEDAPPLEFDEEDLSDFKWDDEL